MTSGASDGTGSTSSGNITLATADAGNDGVSGRFEVHTGSSMDGPSGDIMLATGAADLGAGGDISLSVGTGSSGSGGPAQQ